MNGYCSTSRDFVPWRFSDADRQRVPSKNWFSMVVIVSVSMR